MKSPTREIPLFRLVFVFSSALLVALIGLNSTTSHNYELFAGEFSIIDHDNLPMGQQDRFPTLAETLDMAALSILVYRFYNVSAPPEDDDLICERFNAGQFTPSNVPPDFSIPADLQCHWYYHDRDHEGTQLMITSSLSHNYLALVFAGTDDYQTSLLDLDIRRIPFGDGQNWTLPNVPPRVYVHAGFNNAVFENGLFDQILAKFEEVRWTLSSQHPNLHLHLYSTGHSLGAAASLVAAVGLTSYYHQAYPHHQYNAIASMQEDTSTAGFLRNWRPKKKKKHLHPEMPPHPKITCLNFGEPAVGNRAWRDYIHNAPEMQDLRIWRYVMGWDIVPRLPSTFSHVGHTVQMDGYDGTPSGKGQDSALISMRDDYIDDDGFDPSNSTNVFTGTVDAYYQHYGNKTLGLAAVPMGWSGAPYIWIPGSIAEHFATRYWQFFFDFQRAQGKDDALVWIHNFVPLSGRKNNNNPENYYDDDYFWRNPYHLDEKRSSVAQS